MKDDQPSLSAGRVAWMRAAHQRFDEPRVFDDPLAIRILGPDGVRGIELYRPFARSGPLAGLRAWIAARSRFAEDEVADARARGVDQYVVLGAGLDTFAYRAAAGPSPLTVFEVDRPATQRWKRQLLAEAGIPVPPSVRYVATDFEGDGLPAALAEAGFRPEAAAVFSWLGVTMYLTRPAIRTTLDFLGSAAPGSSVVLDYFDQDAPRPLERIGGAVLDQRLALSGEQFRSWFVRGELASELNGRGFPDVRDLGRDEVNERYFAHREDRLEVVSEVGRLIRAGRPQEVRTGP